MQDSSLEDLSPVQVTAQVPAVNRPKCHHRKSMSSKAQQLEGMWEFRLMQPEQEAVPFRNATTHLKYKA